MRRTALVAALALALIPTGPGVTMAEQPSPRFAALVEEFVFTSLAFSPPAASGNGLHERVDPKTGQKVIFDELLDDLSPEAIARQRAYYADVRKRLAAIPKRDLDPQTRVDYDLVDNAAAFALFSIDDEQFHRRKPQIYPESLGNALFQPMSLEYADQNARAAHFVSRLERAPAFVDRAISNLAESNEIYRKVALEANEGVVSLVAELGPGFVKGTPSEERFEKAKGPALAALERFAAFVKDELPKRPNVDWRMGERRFAEKWRYYLQVSFSPDEMLRIAERHLAETRAEMLRLAEPLHKQWFPDKKIDRADKEAYLNAVVKDVLGRIQEERIGRNELVEATQRDVQKLIEFVREKKLLSITDYPNLRVIPTPEFMRASYGIAGAVFAPALEPNLATFYWVTPIPEEWSEEMAAGRLREYNKYKLLTLHVHEGVPGHVVQGIYANRITPEWRRILRAVYGNTPYVEGWAVYAELMMEEQGLDGGDPVKMRLVSLKAMLRVLTNAIIDIRLHTKNMPGDEAVRMMLEQGFQERPEAVGKLQRAQLDYVQLNTYYAGLREWLALRKEAEAKAGKGFDLARYHDTVLLYGPIPVPKVRELYLAGVAPTAEPVGR
jgi:uncharacterized protein (DUF885 family)